MVTDVPLLNDYKRSFVLNRLLQTFLGGPKLARCPWYAALLQVVLYLAPLAAVVPALALGGGGEEWLAPLSAGAAVGAYAVALQLVSLCAHRREENEEEGGGRSGDRDLEGSEEGKEADGGEARRTRAVGHYNRQLRLRARHLLGEEEETPDLDGCCNASTWTFVIPKKRHKLNVVLHAAAAAVTASAALFFLSPSRVGRSFDGEAERWSILVFGWFSVLNALYSTTVCPPPETAAFRALDELELCAMSRPAHVVLLLAVQLAASNFGDFFGLDGGEWVGLSRAAYAVLALLPVLWVAGVLPPLEPLALWLVEQSQVFLFGGSAAASNGRAFVHLLLSVLQFAALYLAFLIFEFGDLLHLFSVASLSGYLLSLDVPGMVFYLYSRCCCRRRGFAAGAGYGEDQQQRPDSSFSLSNKVRPGSTARLRSASKNKGDQGQLVRISRLFAAFKDFFSHLLCFSLNAAVVFLLPYGGDDCFPTIGPEEVAGASVAAAANGSVVVQTEGKPDPALLRSHLSGRLTALGWISVAALLFLLVANELQKVYMVFGLVRSPLHCSPSPFSSDMGKHPQLFSAVWHHVRSLLVNFGLGLFLTFHLKSLVAEDCLLLRGPSMRQWMEVMAVARMARWAWQSPHSALVEVAVLHIVNILLVPWALDSLYHSEGTLRLLLLETSRPVQILVLGVLRDRLRQALDKTYFSVALSVSSLEDRASRRSYAGCLFQANIFFSPVILFFVMSSSVLSAPLLALFTLPVFFVAFPRPLRFWPGPVGLQANPGSDSMYYRVMLPALVSSVHAANRAGKLGVLIPGDLLIAR